MADPIWSGRDRATDRREVTVRIIIDSSGADSTVVSIYGWIEGKDESHELLRVVRSTLPPVVLDLSELRAADSVGLETLMVLASEGVRLTHASDFIRLMLETSGHSLPVSAVEKNGGTR